MRLVQQPLESEVSRLQTEAKQKPNSQLVERAQSGSTEAFERLVEEHKAQVFRIVRNHVPPREADEVAQQVFIKVHQALATFRGDSPFSHWLSKVAVRVCYDYWRAAGASREVSLGPESLELAVSNMSLEEFKEQRVNENSKEILDWALSKLSADDKMVLTLFYIEEYSEKETAELLGWSVPKVKAHAFQSRRYLRRLLSKLFSSRVV